MPLKRSSLLKRRLCICCVVALSKMRAPLYCPFCKCASIKRATSVAVALLDPARPIVVDATLAGVDLAAVCAELALDEVRLTGRADGRVRLKYEATGLAALDAAVESTGGFTVNRDLIERALLAQFVKDALDEALTKRVRRVLGDAPQRPFDTAGAAVRYDPTSDRFVGELRLESRLLDLPVDVRVDRGAVAEVLRLKQEGLLEGLGGG